jgi:hypothetical protein
MQRRPRHRSSIAMLRQLARQNVFYHHGRRRDDVIGLLPLGEVGARVMRWLADRFGADRERAERECVAEAQRLLGLGARERRSPGERLWLARWAPLVCVLPGVRGWPAQERAALGAVIRAKGGRRESDFVRAFDGHARLRAAVLRLMA